MSLRKIPKAEENLYSDVSFDDELAANDKEIVNKRKVRRLLEERLEKKRLQQEIGNDYEWDDDFIDLDDEK
jgi:hypothetical protein